RFFADMKRIAFPLVVQLLAVSLFAAEAPKECNLCVGAVTDLKVVPATPVPLVAAIRQDDLDAAGAALDAMAPAARAHVALVIGYSVDKDKDPLLDIEAHTKTIIDWARLHGPLDAIGIAVDGA